MARKRKPINPSATPTSSSGSNKAYSTVRKATEEWSRLQLWAHRERIPLRDDAAPPDWVIACYLMLRLTDPNSSPGGHTVQLKTAETIFEVLKTHVRLQGWDDSHLRGKATRVTVVLAAAKRLLAERQITSQRGRPITAVDTGKGPSELDLLLDRLDVLESEPAISNWWVTGWRALLLTGVQGPLRGGEAVTAATSNLRRGEATDGRQICVLTIPRSKWRQKPKDLVFFCVCGQQRSRQCPVHALEDWLAVLKQHSYRGDALFPITPKYDPRLPPAPPTGPVSVRDPEGLRRLAGEISDWCGARKEDLSNAVDDVFEFTCGVCGTLTQESLRSRASRKYGCRVCGLRAAPRPDAGLFQSASGEIRFFVDPVAERLATSAFAADQEQQERHHRAVQRSLNRPRNQFKKLCEEAGIAPRNEFESITLHGLKSGGVTTLALQGVSDLEIQRFAQHTSMNTTRAYIDRFRSHPHATSFLEPWQGEVDPSVLAELAEAIRADESEAA